MSEVKIVPRRRVYLRAAAMPLLALALISAGCAAIHWGFSMAVPGLLLWLHWSKPAPPPRGKGED